jgi:hypothetical protein
LVSGVGLPIVVVDCAEWSTVGGVGLGFRGVRLITFQVSEERILGAISKVGLAVNRDKMGKTIIEGVPEVADPTSFITRHLEAVDIGSEIPGDVSLWISQVGSVLILRGKYLPLGRWATVVGEIISRVTSGVRAILVEIRS